MESRLLAFLVCTAIVAFVVVDNTATAQTTPDVCKNNKDAFLADEHCKLLCNGTTRVKMNASQAEENTPCVELSNGNEVSNMDATVKNGTCISGICKLPGQTSTGTSMTSATQKPAGTSSGASTKGNTTATPSLHQNVTTTQHNASHSPATPDTSSHSNGTTIALPTSHPTTTAHVNETTTNMPGSAASPSRLLGAANQGVVITVLALAVLGRSL